MKIAVALAQAGRGEHALTGAALVAIEVALEVREQTGGEVLAVAAGANAAAGLHRARTMGADRTLLVADAATGEDALAESRVLAAALAREHPDLIVFGQRPSEVSDAVVPAAVARRLGLPLIAGAFALVVDAGAGRLSATRRTEAEEATIEAPLPAVVAVTAAACFPRYPSLYRMRELAAALPAVTSISELGVGANEHAPIVRATRPVGVPQRIEGDADPARRIVDFLAARGLL